ncbi:TetR family transcriptional regulator [Paenibacillus cisolokensis]|uniref:TetR family transcriptional regulator n=1 Tax=Paenibacillus cisolokensis TaxID=1658519 RepID=UPI003D278FDD
MNSSVIRTKKAMKQALIRLLEEKEMRDITISEIGSRAEYSRAAFYAHYLPKRNCLKR